MGRKAAPRVAALLSLLLTGCAAVERGGENALVVASYPVHAVTTPVARMRDRYREDPRAAVVLSPIYVSFYILEDTLFTGVHAVDAALTPLYVPFEVKPLGLYDISSGAPRLRTDEIRKSEEEFLHAAAYPLYVIAWVGLATKWGSGRFPPDGPASQEP